MFNLKPEQQPETESTMVQTDPVMAWRRRLLDTVLIGAAGLGFLAVIATVINDIGNQNWRDLIIVLIVYVLLLITTLVRRLSYVLRAGVLELILFVLMINSLTNSGLRGDARLFAVIFVIISLAFFGSRAGWGAVVLSSLSMIAVGWAVVNQHITLNVVFDQLKADAWIQNIVTSLLINVVALLVLLILQQEFSSSLEREQQVRKRMIADNEQLETRVTARSRDLATVAEVGTATATILESRKLLQEVVDLTKERFNLYHTHIYLLDDEGKNLVLAAGAGEPGRIMAAEGRSIPLDREQSLVARAAREGKGVTVNDVTQAPDFLPNPLLPNTRSELAVPMIVAGNVIGVFDIQSEEVGRFTDTDINIQTTLAAQLAASIQNVRTFEQSRKQAELESLVNAIGQKIQRATSIEETLKIGIREVGLALGAPEVSASVSRREDRGNLTGTN